MSSGNPLVTVVIDNFNYAAYLGEAIESALAQTWPHTEVIVVDDGSTDDSRHVIGTFGDRIRVVVQANRGQAAAFNAGVDLARGDVICFLDSDDVWFPEKVERVVAAFTRYPQVAWLRHRLRVVDEMRQPQGASLPVIRSTRVRLPAALKFIEGCFPVLTSGLALRRGIVGHVFPLPEVTHGSGGFPGVDLKLDADAYVAFRAASTGEPFLSLDEELGLYRRHPQQRYASAANLQVILKRQIALAAGVSSAFGEQLGPDVVPSSVYKHRAVLAALEGRSLLHPDRISAAAAGVRRIVPLARVSPWLFARQSIALALGTLAPRLWLRKLIHEQGYTWDGNDR